MDFATELLRDGYVAANTMLDNVVHDIGAKVAEEGCTIEDAWSNTIHALCHFMYHDRSSLEVNIAVYAAAIIRLHIMSTIDMEKVGGN